MPRLLQQSAAWAWRLLLTGLVIYLAFRLAVFLRLVTLPFIAAMLLTALLQPSAALLRRRGFSPLLATWCTFLVAIVVIAGAITLLGNQISADYPVLFAELQKTANGGAALAGRPPVPSQPGAAVHAQLRRAELHLPAQVGRRRHGADRRQVRGRDSWRASS